jgi:hypothetical protein
MRTLDVPGCRLATSGRVCPDSAAARRRDSDCTCLADLHAAEDKVRLVGLCGKYCLWRTIALSAWGSLLRRWYVSCTFYALRRGAAVGGRVVETLSTTSEGVIGAFFGRDRPKTKTAYDPSKTMQPFLLMRRRE